MMHAASIRRLDDLAQATEYLPLTTAAMRKAAELWGRPGNRGSPPRATTPSTPT